MTTKALEDVLKDDSLSHERKFDILKQAKLSYSVIFELQEIFKYDNEIFNMLSYFTYYQDNRLDSKLSLQNKTNYGNRVYNKRHRKRRKTHDKYKR